MGRRDGKVKWLRSEARKCPTLSARRLSALPRTLPPQKAPRARTEVGPGPGSYSLRGGVGSTKPIPTPLPRQRRFIVLRRSPADLSRSRRALSALGAFP